MLQPVQKTPEEWRQLLGAQKYQILRQSGTQAPGTGEYDRVFPKTGYFGCGGCETPLYAVDSKFPDNGWVAFDKCFYSGDKCHVGVKPDYGSLEVICNACGGHLGHVFYGENHTPTCERH